MPENYQNAVAQLSKYGFAPTAFAAVTDAHKEHVMQALARTIKKLSSSGLQGITRTLVQAIFYHTEGSQVYIYQFIPAEAVTPKVVKLKFSLTGDTRPTIQLSTEQTTAVNTNQLSLRLVGSSPHTEATIEQLKQQTDEEKLLLIELHAHRCPIANCHITDDLEKLLMLHINEIQTLVKAKGCWDLPDCIYEKFPRLKLIIKEANRQLSTEVKQQACDFFARSPLFLKKFCYFKIKEIVDYGDEAENRPACQEDIIISVIEQKQQTYYLFEAKLIFFNGRHVASITATKTESDTSVLSILRKSSWHVTHPAKNNVIRLSDQRLEDSLAVQYCIAEQTYGVLSKSLGLKASAKGLNFWEDLACNLTTRQARDETQIGLIAEELKASRHKVIKKPRIEPQFNIELQDQKFSQADFALQILMNQRANRGTLLNLPTGYGKTYILLMAMAQHLHDVSMNNRKPYLVVAPKKSIRDHWLSTLTEELRNRLFPEQPNVYSEAQGSSLSNTELLNTIRTGNYCVVILTNDRLKLIVDEFFSAAPGLKAKASYDEFINILNETKYPLLKMFGQRLRNIEPAIFNKTKFFVMGNRDDWQEILEENQEQLSRERGANFDSSTISRIIAELTALQAEQIRRIQKYEAFKALFNGIVLDESHELISVKSSNDFSQTRQATKRRRKKDEDIGIKPTHIILDFAKTYQCSGSVGAVENRLVLASSATPWPNNMDELKLHMRFIYSSLLGEFHQLNDALFRHWGRFETSIEEHCGGEAQVTPEFLQKKLGKVSNSFMRWVRLLFHYGVRYESPEESNNLSHEKIIYSQCQRLTDSTPVVDSKQSFQMIRSFYSAVLGLRAQQDPQSQHGVQGNLYREIMVAMRAMPTFPKKIAFFVELKKDAAQLALRLSKEFESAGDCFIGLFYGDTLKEIGTSHTTITQRVSRDCNRNAFNNILSFDDLAEYAHEMFHPKTIAVKYKGRYTLKLLPALRAIQAIGTNKVEASLAALNDATSTVPTAIKEAVTKYVRFKTNNPDQSLSDCELPDIEKTKIEFLIKVVALEKKSQHEIIMDFDEELKVFEKFLLKFKGTLIERFQKVYRLLTNADQPTTGKTASWHNDEFKVFYFSFLAYIYKIARSNILILGDAGTSGMRVDADVLTLLSGAWTEGKLTQVKGRVGRKKGQSGQQRHCEILLPLTNSVFELKILSYFIRKYLYNEIITGRRDLSPRDIIEPLMYALNLSQHYIERVNGGTIIYPEIHTAIQAQIDAAKRAQTKDYLALPPCDKAKILIPKALSDWLANIGILCDGLPQQRLVVLDDLVSDETLLRASEWQDDHVEEASTEYTEGHDAASAAPAAKRPRVAPSSRPKPVSYKPLIRRIPNKPIPRPRNARPRIVPMEYDIIPSYSHADFQYSNSLNLIIVVPTRGKAPDIPFERFIAYVRQAVRKYDVSVTLIYAINAHEAEAQNIKHILQAIEPEVSAKVLPIVTSFFWQSELDQHGKLQIPYGMIRNYCLLKAQERWQEIHAEHPDTVATLCIDSDTILTTTVLERFLAWKNTHPNFLMTTGYEMIPAPIAQDPLLLAPHEHAPNAAWQQYWLTLASRICNDVNSKLYDRRDNQEQYFGYMAEPIHFISTGLTTLLFSQALKLDSEELSPYGFWSFEGRHLVKFLRKMSASQAYLVIGPSPDFRKRSIHTNNQRFSIPIPTRMIKSILTREELVQVLTVLHNHPQHIINHRFAANNIAAFLQIRSGDIIEYASYLRMKPMLILLALGPQRCLKFAKMLYEFIQDEHYNFAAHFDARTWGISLEDFSTFVNGKFKQQFITKEHFTIYATLAAVWARAIAERIMYSFKDYYQGEYQNGRYAPMQLPDDYPVRAKAIAAEDDKQLEAVPPEALSLTTITNTIVTYLSQNTDAHPAPSWIQEKLTQDCGANLAFVGYTQDNKVIAVLTFPETIARTARKQICETVHAKICEALPVQKHNVTALVLTRQEEHYTLRFTKFQNDNLTFFSAVNQKGLTLADLQENLSSIAGLSLSTVVTPTRTTTASTTSTQARRRPRQPEAETTEASSSQATSEAPRKPKRARMGAKSDSTDSS